MSLIHRRFYNFIVALCLFAGGGVYASSAPAQTVPQVTSRSGFLPGAVSLRDGQNDYALGPVSAVTADEKGTIGYSDLIARHLAGRPGKISEHSVLPLGVGGAPHWIVFAVKNDTAATARWVLTLGGHADGRYGVYNRLFVYDQLSARYLLYAMPDRAGAPPRPAALPLNGTGIPFSLPPGSQALLTVYIAPDAGAPVTLAPHLLTEQAFWESQRNLFSMGQAAPVLLLLAMGYFTGLLLLGRSLAALPVIAYLLAQLLLYRFQDASPYSDFPLASDCGPLWLFCCVVFGMIMTASFLGTRGGRGSAIAGGVMAAAAVIDLIALFAIPAASPAHALILLLVPAAGLFFLSLFAFAQALTGKPAAALVAAGWLILLAGFVIGALGQSGLLEPALPVVNAYWLALLLQCALLIGASLARLWALRLHRGQPHGEKLQDEDAVARIREARENSENARLVKVIEHERSILQELRDREVQQNEDMRRAKEAADLANRAKSAFLAVISHEIRTPMSGIMGMVRLLQDTTLTRDQNDYARTIQDSGDAMLALLNDILDFEKIESGKMDLETVDFDLLRLISDILTLMSGHAGQKNIALKTEIDTDVPRYVRGDPVRLRQVLLNLTGNAIKFTSEGSVTLTLKKSAEGGDREGRHRLYFGVRDSGIGISPAAQKNLFTPFSQADNSISRKYGGSGLGLAICQRLIEAMGGKIALDSTEGRGSTFFFTIDMEDGQAERVQDLSSALSSRYNTKAERALNVLCVDDNEINRKLLKEFVGRMGHVPTLAETGEQALDLIRESRFDAVLMDIELPGISGMGATKAIRALADRDRAALPVIALTGNVRDEDIRACYAANMNGHLAKPIEPDKLKAQLDKVIHGRLDNPVKLEAVQTVTAHPQQVKISDTRPAGLSGLSFEDHDDVLPPPGGSISSIRAYAMQTEQKPSLQISAAELDEDSFGAALEQRGQTMNDGNVFDHALLDALKSSMKSAELKDMVASLTAKNDEIIAALQNGVTANDIAGLVARAHEMKGMAGNFGLTALAGLADAIEKIARTNRMDGIAAIVAKLPEEQEKARAALDRWMAA